MITIAYILSSIMFIFGVKGLSSSKTAHRGNMLAMIAMLIAIVITLLHKKIHDFSFIIASSFIGSTVSVILAKKAKLTEVSRIVAFYNGLGGAVSVSVALIEHYLTIREIQLNIIISIVLGLLIGMVTITGSLVVYAKLRDFVKPAPGVCEIKHSLHLLLFIVCLVFCVIISFSQTCGAYLLAFFVISSALGILIVIPIGGANMQVVVSLLISYAGFAAVATGFLLSSNIFIMSGIIICTFCIALAIITCNTMNRSLPADMLKSVKVTVLEDSDRNDHHKVIAHAPEDSIILLENAQSIIIVPGYGLVVAQAQEILHDLENVLTKRGANVRYALHPAAGRVPGQLPALLKEAKVSPNLLFATETINDDFQNTDVALVIGANDIINPAAKNTNTCLLHDMPVLNANKAKTVIICKRSLSPGFSGADSELFYNQKTLMIFGDVKDSVTTMVKFLKARAEEKEN
ncbi:MAG: NAD synthetase [Candidatus Brocadia sp.]|nr:NAD(P)(+) transhydrogenase (Re/Si-specific) subunit beta [Candidatus Brocadia sp.]MCE7912326.1 NAD(P)(+) transhydrogenase (Re/Si-specific) subunit beta [Candidatus Brocadia sp. AMX3]MDG5997915.1 NAD(P)(+) transhydrogenase (Re/Si-specific) subunit beta [Candidatus Brocadia sp.]RIJ92602.1 MAG: NAD synthetase [Candidatus Brocadia sp.]